MSNTPPLPADYAPITEVDFLWMRRFNPTLSNPSIAVLDTLNKDLATGSIHITQETDPQRETIIGARIGFFAVLGFEGDNLDNLMMRNATLSPLSTTIDTLRYLEEVGLDAFKIINASPAAIGLSPESVRDKVANLTNLGLDAVKIINALPAAISYAPESVRDKVRLIKRGCKVLDWRQTPIDFINSYPAILGFNPKKIRILRRIIAESSGSMQLSVSEVKGSAITPLEKYIVAASQLDKGYSLNDLKRKASKDKTNPAERKERALDAATLIGGRIAKMYLDYRRIA